MGLPGGCTTIWGSLYHNLGAVDPSGGCGPDLVGPWASVGVCQLMWGNLGCLGALGLARGAASLT